MNRLLNESTKEAAKSTAATSGDHVINLIMRSKSPHLLSVLIKCSNTLEINAIAQTYCDSQKVSIYDIRFYYNNKRIRISNDDTIKSLNIKEGDEIQVIYVGSF